MSSYMFWCLVVSKYAIHIEHADFFKVLRLILPLVSFARTFYWRFIFPKSEVVQHFFLNTEFIIWIYIENVYMSLKGKRNW
jgi:hypothetical protein